MKIAIALIVAIALCLAACSLKAKWRDTTNRGRTSEQADPDVIACQDETGYGAINRDSTGEEIQAAFTKLETCMSARGWELVQNNSN